MHSGIFLYAKKIFFIICLALYYTKFGDIVTNKSLHEKKNFRLTKICEKDRQDHISLLFACFRFTEISYFLNFPSNKNVRKHHLSANAYYYVNMKLSYTVAVRKDEIFCDIVMKTSNFLVVFRSTFR